VGLTLRERFTGVEDQGKRSSHLEEKSQSPLLKIDEASGRHLLGEKKEIKNRKIRRRRLQEEKKGADGSEILSRELGVELRLAERNPEMENREKN